jgi:nucleotide-binding universal stress UspA family protein
MRLDRVLAGVTFDEPTTRGIGWVARHVAPGAKLVLLHCVEDGSDEGAATAEERLRALAERAAPGAECLVRSGSPEKLILQTAGESNADLIAIGPRAESTSALGSTAERILAGSEAPVVVTRPAPDRAPGSILAVVDESPVGNLVLRWARALSARWDAATAVLHVVTRTMYGPVRTVSSGTSTDRAMLHGREGTQAWLEEQVRAAGISPADVRIELAEGTPSETILQLAERDGTDLIVLGSRGAGLVGRALLGSTAGSVIRQAGCPVFVVPGRATARDRAESDRG